MWSRAAPEHGSTATSVGWLKPVRPSLTRQTSTSSRSCINALSMSTGWGIWETALRCCSIMLQFHILLFGYSLFLGFAIVQYHQVPDEYFTSAVVLSLILAALFGLVYLLIIPQYVPKMLLWVPSLSFFFFFFPFPLFYLSSCLFNIPKSVLLTPSFPSLLFSLSGAQWC